MTLNQYRENGFIVIEDFLSQEELEFWRDRTYRGC
jgi:hypothetical protein